MFLPREVSQLEWFFCEYTRTRSPLTCVRRPWLGARHMSRLFEELIYFFFPLSCLFFFAPLPRLSRCFTRPINNVILKQWLPRAGVITSSIIWPHLSLYCKQPSLEPQAFRHTQVYTSDWWACINILYVELHWTTREDEQTGWFVTFLLSSSSSPRLPPSLRPVNCIAINRHWSQGLVSLILHI